MTGLRLMNELSDPALRDATIEKHIHVGTAVLDEEPPKPLEPAGEERSPSIHVDYPIQPVAYLDRKVRTVPDLAEIWSYVNPYMLFGRHLGFRGSFEKALAGRDPRALELQAAVDEVKEECASYMKIGAVWQFFEAERRGNSIALFEPSANAPVHTFHFQRQRLKHKLCLSDYVLPSVQGERDHLALVRRHCREEYPRKIRRSEGRRPLPFLTCASGARHRDRRSLCGMAASSHP